MAGTAGAVQVGMAAAVTAAAAAKAAAGMAAAKEAAAKAAAVTAAAKAAAKEAAAKAVAVTAAAAKEAAAKAAPDIDRFNWNAHSSAREGVVTLLTRAHKKFHPLDSSCSNGFAPRDHRRRSEGPVRSR
jgi:hypothetical protein